MWASEAPSSSISKNQKKYLKSGHFYAKILLFRTHHLWNSTTELILISNNDDEKCCFLKYFGFRRTKFLFTARSRNTLIDLFQDHEFWFSYSILCIYSHKSQINYSKSHFDSELFCSSLSWSIASNISLMLPIMADLLWQVLQPLLCCDQGKHAEVSLNSMQIAMRQTTKFIIFIILPRIFC